METAGGPGPWAGRREPVVPTGLESPQRSTRMLRGLPTILGPPGQAKERALEKKKKKMRFDENIFQMGWGRPGGMMLMIMIASIA